jgi:hypothetical protein
MPARRPRQRIEIDALFAPLPQDLILDARVSAPAARLWGVLYVFRWNGNDPDFPDLAAAMATSERSVYRWLQELEQRGWIDWDKHASLQDRFTLRTAPGGVPIDTCVKFGPDDLTPRSKELIPRSNDLIPGSKSLTQVSIFEGTSGVETPQTDPTQKIQNHEKIQKVGVGGGALAEALADRGLNPASIEKIIRHGYDPEAILQSLDNMLADGAARGQDPDKVCGRFVVRLRLSPPEKGKPYGRRSVQSSAAANQPGRHAAQSAAHRSDQIDPGWRDRLIAEAEQRAREAGGDGG